MKAIPYAGALRWRRRKIVVKIGGGFAACATGDLAHRIAASCNHTYDRAAVTCKACLTRIAWAKATPPGAWAA